MRDIKFAVGRLPTDARTNQGGIVASQRARKHCTCLRICAQPQNRRTRGRIRNLIVSVWRARDGVGMAAEAERGSILLHGAEPRLVNKLIEAFR